IGAGFSHFGHHSGASILDCGCRAGSMIGTAITTVLRGAGIALPALVLCAAPAAAQFSFPFGAPPPPSSPAPSAPVPNAGGRARNPMCLRLESQLPALERGPPIDPPTAEQSKRHEDAAAKH